MRVQLVLINDVEFDGVGSSQRKDDCLIVGTREIEILSSNDMNAENSQRNHYEESSSSVQNENLNSENVQFVPLHDINEKITSYNDPNALNSICDNARDIQSDEAQLSYDPLIETVSINDRCSPNSSRLQHDNQTVPSLPADPELNKGNSSDNSSSSFHIAKKFFNVNSPFTEFKRIIGAERIQRYENPVIACQFRETDEILEKTYNMLKKRHIEDTNEFELLKHVEPKRKRARIIRKKHFVTSSDEYIEEEKSIKEKKNVKSVKKAKKVIL